MSNPIARKDILENNFINPNLKGSSSNLENSELSNILARQTNKGRFDQNLIKNEENNKKISFENNLNDEKFDESFDKSLIEMKKKYLEDQKNVSFNNPKGVDFGFMFKLQWCFANKNSNTQRRKIKAYEFLMNYLNKRLDLIYYLKRLNKGDLINSFIFNEIQNKTLDYLEKPNVFINEEISLFENEDDKAAINEIMQEYKNKIKNKHLNKFDKKLFVLLPDKIKFQIV